MNRDNMILAILVAFPVVVVGFFVVIELLQRRLGSTECPHCFQRIPKDAFKHGLPCLECGAVLAEAQSRVDTSRLPRACRKCVTGDDCLELWDGEVYCRNCIGKQSSRLLQAAESDQLGEEMSYSIPSIAWRMFLFAMATMIGFSTLVAVLLIVAGGGREAPGAFAVVLVISSPVIVMFTAGVSIALPLLRPKTIVWNRQLIVRLGSQLRVSSLAECRWYEGRMSQVNVWGSGFLLRGKALIVEIPNVKTGEGNRMAVGCTDESREIWKSFFELAEIPQKRRKQSWWSSWFRPRASPEITAAKSDAT